MRIVLIFSIFFLYWRRIVIGLKSIEAVIGFIILFLVYIVSVTPAGCFRAWVAKKMGDDTAESLGFLTLNPLPHIDPIGIIVLFLFSDVVRAVFPGISSGRSVPIYTGFGWGRQIPVDITHIHGRYRWLKLALVLFSDTFIHFCLPIVALIMLKFVLVTGALYGEISPATLIALQLYRAFVYLNVWLLVVEGAINAVMFGVLYYGRSGSLREVYQLSYVALFIPLIIVFLFGPVISSWIVNAINMIGGLVL